MCFSEEHPDFCSRLWWVVLCTVLLLSCAEPLSLRHEQRFRFCVADVGQGLSQFGSKNEKAVVWDMGPADQYGKWETAYQLIGKPRLEVIIISHTDEDHLGGLAKLEGSLDWSGKVIVSPLEDTAKVRSRAGVWSERITFGFCARFDTLRILDSVLIVCLWPPGDIEVAKPLSGADKNRLSLVFMVQHGSNRVLITSDIDTSAQRMIARDGKHAIHAQIMIAPHHGSAGSVDPVFFGYVFPDLAVFSCSEKNSYGHPSPRMMDQFLSQGANMFFTYLDGTVVMESNCHYWSLDHN